MNRTGVPILECKDLGDLVGGVMFSSIFASHLSAVCMLPSTSNHSPSNRRVHWRFSNRPLQKRERTGKELA